MPIEGIGKQITRDISVFKFSWKRPSLVNDAATSDMPTFEAFVWDVLEVAEGKRIVQRTVLGEAFNVITTLNLVQHGRGPPIGAGDGVAVLIKIKAPSIAAPLGEQLEFVSDRMITPDALLEFQAANVSRARASLGTIEPTVRPPLNRVGHG